MQVTVELKIELPHIDGQDAAVDVISTAVMRCFRNGLFNAGQEDSPSYSMVISTEDEVINEPASTGNEGQDHGPVDEDGTYTLSRTE